MSCVCWVTSRVDPRTERINLSTVYKQRDKSVPRKHHADYTDRAAGVQQKQETYIEWSTALNIHNGRRPITYVFK